MLARAPGRRPPGTGCSDRGACGPARQSSRLQAFALACEQFVAAVVLVGDVAGPVAAVTAPYGSWEGGSLRCGLLH